jgi:hypothetical protein
MGCSAKTGMVYLKIANQLIVQGHDELIFVTYRLTVLTLLTANI